MSLGKIAVSSCFVNKVRYNGSDSNNEDINRFLKVMKDNNIEVVFVCPELLGGLKVPRESSEKQGDKVVTISGIDITDNFNVGAHKVLEILKRENIDIAILKSKSPSCGKGIIYDGTFSGTLTEGNGVTVELLSKNNIKVYSSDDLGNLDFIKNHFGIDI